MQTSNVRSAWCVEFKNAPSVARRKAYLSAIGEQFSGPCSSPKTSPLPVEKVQQGLKKSLFGISLENGYLCH